MRDAWCVLGLLNGRPPAIVLWRCALVLRLVPVAVCRPPPAPPAPPAPLRWLWYLPRACDRLRAARRDPIARWYPRCCCCWYCCCCCCCCCCWYCCADGGVVALPRIGTRPSGGSGGTALRRWRSKLSCTSPTMAAAAVAAAAVGAVGAVAAAAAALVGDDDDASAPGLGLCSCPAVSANAKVLALVVLGVLDAPMLADQGPPTPTSGSARPPPKPRE